MGESDRAYREQQATQGNETEAADVDVEAEAEHDGAAARRASLAGLRPAQYSSKGAIPPVAEGGRDAGPTASERAYDKPETEMPTAYMGHELSLRAQ